ncbi:hypothetical protein EJB05_54305, partial [Eragrostis curvula]
MCRTAAAARELDQARFLWLQDAGRREVTQSQPQSVSSCYGMQWGSRSSLVERFTVSVTIRDWAKRGQKGRRQILHQNFAISILSILSSPTGGSERERHVRHGKKEKQGTCHGARQTGDLPDSRRGHEYGRDEDVKKDHAHQVGGGEQGKESDGDDDGVVRGDSKPPEIKNRV